MADLSKWNETRSWLAEWETYRWAPTALRTIKRAAVEQRANYEACASTRRWPSSFNPAEYLRCVQAIEAAVPRAEARAANEM
jgi:hypothetical protein